MSPYLVQVATPFAAGTGLRTGKGGMIVTNAHVVGDNASIIVGGSGMEEQLARVIYLDTFHDLAFLRVDGMEDLPPLPFAEEVAGKGDALTLEWQLFGQRPRSLSGETVGLFHHHHQDLLTHDAREGRTVAGGALFGEGGKLLGLNMLDHPEREAYSLALPAPALAAVVREFTAGRGRSATRCFECREVVFEEPQRQIAYCPVCGSEIVLPSRLRDAEPAGVNATIEAIIRAADHDPLLARRGPNLWSIRQGSATIQLAYHEDSGLVTGDAYLCQLPEAAPAGLYAFLLRENTALRQLSFSTYGRDIILSLLIYDRYLSVETALPRFAHLFAKADYYDNVLVEEYGAGWGDQKN
jgi:serine protease Do